MKPETEDCEVLAALESLPREQARAGFTAAVLAEAWSASAAPVPGWSRATVLLAASVVLLTVLSAGILERTHQRQEIRGQVSALRFEHEELERELAEIKRLSTEQPAMVYLGGDDDVDVVLRLDPSVTTHPSNLKPGAAVPASTVRN
ncbi:MAG: hypothetical protein ABI609_04455 [Acidobacteriota bacterium]